MSSPMIDLIKIDISSSKRWFEKETIWKTLIALTFTGVIVGVGLLIYYFSTFYFKYLLEFELYGELTAGYILRAVILILAWIGILSSFISTLSFLLSPNKSTDFLVTLPYDPLNIIGWQTIKTFLLNFSLFLITILPITLAYYSGKNIGVVNIALRSVSVLLILSLLVESLGSSFAYLIANRLKRKDGIIYIILASLVAVLGTAFVFNMIFPQSLSLLEDVQIENFTGVFYSLPLIKYCFIANSLAGMLEVGVRQSFLLMSLITSALLVISLLIQKTLFLSNWQQVRLDLHLPRALTAPNNIQNLGLVKKDLLSIARVPKEFSYGIFLFLMLLAFLGLFARGIEVNRIPTRFVSSAVVFSWFWLIFYSGTYIIRLVFPLMAREGRTRWWLFTLPQKPIHLVTSKAVTGLLISSPLILVAILEWIISPTGSRSPHLLVSGIFVIIWLSIALSLIGMIRPDYSTGDDPEKVSTGLAGLSALTVVVIAGISLSFLINLSTLGTITVPDSLSLLFLGGVVTIIPIFLIALRSTEKHTVEV